MTFYFIRHSNPKNLKRSFLLSQLSFSFAKPITKAETDRTETFRFDIGTTF